MPKPSIQYTLTFTRHTTGYWSFTCTRLARQISERLETYSSLDICRQKAYAFLCFAVHHYHDREAFRITEREVREGRRRNRRFAPTIDPEHSNLAPIAMLKQEPRRDPVKPLALQDL